MWPVPVVASARPTLTNATASKMLRKNALWMRIFMVIYRRNGDPGGQSANETLHKPGRHTDAAKGAFSSKANPVAAA